MNDRMIPLTDRFGAPLLHPDDLVEPLPGSVVLTDGLHGTAWQRHFSDGKWHSSRGGKPQEWDAILAQHNVVLAYDAEEREERVPLRRKADC